MKALKQVSKAEVILDLFRYSCQHCLQWSNIMITWSVTSLHYTLWLV